MNIYSDFVINETAIKLQDLLCATALFSAEYPSLSIFYKENVNSLVAMANKHFQSIDYDCAQCAIYKKCMLVKLKEGE